MEKAETPLSELRQITVIQWFTLMQQGGAGAEIATEIKSLDQLRDNRQ